MAGVAVAFLGQVGGGGTYLGRVGRVGQFGQVGRRDGWVLAGRPTRPTCLTCPTCPIRYPPPLSDLSDKGTPPVWIWVSWVGEKRLSLQ